MLLGEFETLLVLFNNRDTIIYFIITCYSILFTPYVIVSLPFPPYQDYIVKAVFATVYFVCFVVGVFVRSIDLYCGTLMSCIVHSWELCVR